MVSNATFALNVPSNIRRCLGIVFSLSSYSPRGLLFSPFQDRFFIYPGGPKNGVHFTPSLTVTDLLQTKPERSETRYVLIGRSSMVVVAVLGVMIAFATRRLNLRIEDLFIFYGTWRASTMIPTYVTLLHGPIGSKRVFSSIVLSMVRNAARSSRTLW